jgi:hypothetical protein
MIGSSGDTRLSFCPQPPDVHIDNVDSGEILVAPYLLSQLGA